MLVCVWLVTVVRNVPLHVLVEAPETVTERSVLDSLLIRDHVVVEGTQSTDRVHYKVTVARNSAHRVSE